MKDRSKRVRSLRPVLGLPKDLTDGNEVNLFQTEVLRPILKYQNSLLLLCFRNRVFIKGEPQTEKEQQESINASLSRDIHLKNLLLGMVVGLFTEDELVFYIDNQKEINKRITSMLRQRLLTQLQKAKN